MLFIWVFYDPLIFLRPSIFYRLENTQSYAIEFSTLAFPKKVIIEEVFKFVFFLPKIYSRVTILQVQLKI